MGAKPPELPELVRAQDRMTFIYLERCHIHRDQNAITSTDERGTVHIPAAALGALLLGPGTTVTQQAMLLMAESGSTVVWVGEEGVRYYAHGRSLAHSSRLLEAQAQLMTNQSSRLRVAREMYAMRFPGEDTSGLTIQQLRGREGARVRKAYREHSKRTGVTWDRRTYEVEDFFSSDPVNQALSAANTSLYGVVHSVIVALGCSPGLGFVHTGHVRSFVYDIADLYKAELSIPLAFDLASDPPLDIGAAARRALRDSFHGGAFLDRCVRDIRHLLLPDEDNVALDAGMAENVVQLWDGTRRAVAAGTSYAEETAVVVLVLSACPPGLRGYLTRWLLEISAGVFVGKVSRRVRELMWQRTIEMTRTGRAIMVHTARNEQGLAFQVHGHHWEPVDVDGIALMLRPAQRTLDPHEPARQSPTDGTPRRTGWSKAAQRRRLP